MKKSDIKSLVKESMREAFYTRKPLTEGFSLIVGKVDDQGQVQGEDTAKTGERHEDLFGGWNEGDQDWRYSELTKIVYWKYKHDDEVEKLVQRWLQNEGFQVRNHVTFENISDPQLYQKLWYDAHGKGIRFMECSLSEESLDILTEAYGEYIKSIGEEIDSWIKQ